VLLDGFKRWAFWPDADGRVTYDFQPLFSARRTQTNLLFKNGARQLLSFYRLPPAHRGEGGEYEIATLRIAARDLLAK
jgi:hypothetical protein